MKAVRVSASAALVILLAGCSWFQGANPLAVAETAEQKAFAWYGIYVATQEAALSIVSSPETPLNVKQGIASVNGQVQPAANNMRDSAVLVFEIREQLAAGETGEEQLVIATDNLASWTAQAVPLITNFRKLVEAQR